MAAAASYEAPAKASALVCSQVTKWSGDLTGHIMQPQGYMIAIMFAILRSFCADPSSKATTLLLPQQQHTEDTMRRQWHARSRPAALRHSNWA